MGLAFLAPLLLAGTLLLAVPWLIHQIRRPERETLRFSSLMFVPKIKKEIIERRKVQHLLLLLLRMLLFLLLVLAFSRPARRSERVTAAPDRSGGFHLILLDTSYSMGMGDRWAKARRAAEAVLEGLPNGAAVGLVTFADQPSLPAPLSGDRPEDGSIDAVRRAFERALPGGEGTRYLPALQLASQILFAAAPPQEERAPNLELHLISDFQRRGLPGQDAGWKLSGLIRLIAHPVGGDVPDNLAVDQVTVRVDARSRLTVAARIKNWTQGPVEVEVRLHLADGKTEAEIERKTIRLEPANAGTISFVAGEGGAPIQGWLELERDGVAVDNSGYFVWRPARERELFLLTGEDERKPWSASWFMRRALIDSGASDWNVGEGGPAALGSWPRTEASTIETVIAVGLTQVSAASLARLMDWVERGGRLLLCLGPEVEPAGVSPMLVRLGLRFEGPRLAHGPASTFDIFARIDFGHPVFSPFQGSRFNDFSQIRFTNYAELAPASAQAEESPAYQVLATFSSSGARESFPAMIEAPLGKGRVLIWTFAPDLETGNFAKNIKFLPVLHETVKYLLGPRVEVTALRVGEPWRPARGAEDSTPRLQRMTAAGGEWKDLETGRSGDALAMPGLLRVRGGGEAEAKVYAVNLDARESDPESMDVREFGLKLTSTSTGNRETSPATAAAGETQTTALEEYGSWLLPLIFLLLVLEIWFAARLSKRGGRETAGAPS